MQLIQPARTVLWGIKADLEIFENLHAGYCWGDSYGCQSDHTPPAEAAVLRDEFVRMHRDFGEVKWLVIATIHFVDRVDPQQQGEFLSAMSQLADSYRHELAGACKRAYPAVSYSAIGSPGGFTIGPETDGVESAGDNFVEKVLALMKAQSVQDQCFEEQIGTPADVV
jgi:hypothetical protein